MHSISQFTFNAAGFYTVRFNSTFNLMMHIPIQLIQRLRGRYWMPRRVTLSLAVFAQCWAETCRLNIPERPCRFCAVLSRDLSLQYSREALLFSHSVGQRLAASIFPRGSHVPHFLPLLTLPVVLQCLTTLWLQEQEFVCRIGRVGSVLVRAYTELTAWLGRINKSVNSTYRITSLLSFLCIRYIPNYIIAVLILIHIDSNQYC